MAEKKLCLPSLPLAKLYSCKLIMKPLKLKSTWIWFWNNPHTQQHSITLPVSRRQIKKPRQILGLNARGKSWLAYITDGEPSEGTASFPWSSVWFCNLLVRLHVPKCSANVTPNRIHIAWNIKPRARSPSYVLRLESERKRMILFGWQYPKWARQAHHNKQTCLLRIGSCH